MTDSISYLNNESKLYVLNDRPLNADDDKTENVKSVLHL